MKVKFDKWEIEIEANHIIDPKGADEDTKIFLNFLSILYSETAELLKIKAKEAIKAGDYNLAETKVRVAAMRDDASLDIYKKLAANGFYDDIR